MQFSFPPAVGLLPRNRTHTQLRGKETGKSGAILDNIYFAFRLSLYSTWLSWKDIFITFCHPPPTMRKQRSNLTIRGLALLLLIQVSTWRRPINKFKSLKGVSSEFASLLYHLLLLLLYGAIKWIYSTDHHRPGRPTSTVMSSEALLTSFDLIVSTLSSQMQQRLFKCTRTNSQNNGAGHLIKEPQGHRMIIWHSRID